MITYQIALGNIDVADDSDWGRKTKNFKDKIVHQIKKDGVTHTYTSEEMTAYCKSINLYLKDDPDLADCMPINPDGQ